MRIRIKKKPDSKSSKDPPLLQEFKPDVQGDFSGDATGDSPD